jgi:hypothetical protein
MTPNLREKHAVSDFLQAVSQNGLAIVGSLTQHSALFRGNHRSWIRLSFLIDRSIG